jgi:hypothetical protein
MPAPKVRKFGHPFRDKKMGLDEALAVLDHPDPKNPALKRPKSHYKASDRTKAWRALYPMHLYHPELVGVVPGYPGTHEAWTERRDKAKARFTERQKAGVMTRKGSVVGAAHLRQAIADSRKWREIEGRLIVAKMIEKDLIETPVHIDLVDVADNEAAMSALALCVAVVRSDTYSVRERLEAARTTLNFTKSKPVQKVENTIRTAEDWLSGLASEVVMPS